MITDGIIKDEKVAGLSNFSTGFFNCIIYDGKILQN